MAEMADLKTYVSLWHLNQSMPFTSSWTNSQVTHKRSFELSQAIHELPCTFFPYDAVRIRNFDSYLIDCSINKVVTTYQMHIAAAYHSYKLAKTYVMGILSPNVTIFLFFEHCDRFLGLKFWETEFLCTIKGING